MRDRISGWASGSFTVTSLQQTSVGWMDKKELKKSSKMIWRQANSECGMMRSRLITKMATTTHVESSGCL